jgi:hypothetical protein
VALKTNVTITEQQKSNRFILALTIVLVLVGFYPIFVPIIRFFCKILVAATIIAPIMALYLKRPWLSKIFHWFKFPEVSPLFFEAVNETEVKRVTSNSRYGKLYARNLHLLYP